MPMQDSPDKARGTLLARPAASQRIRCRTCSSEAFVSTNPMHPALLMALAAAFALSLAVALTLALALALGAGLALPPAALR